MLTFALTVYVQRLSGKRSELKALEKKLAPMEDLFARFRAWLAKSQMQLASLEPRPSAAEKEERMKTLKLAQVVATCGKLFASMNALNFWRI